MKKVSLILCSVVITSMLLSFFGGTSIYSSVTISNQEWMAENLNVDKFRNGDAIPEAKTKEEWKEAINNKQPAWCYYDNDPAKGKKYGKLYNWYAVNDPRGLAPVGWHIPSDAEWTTLTDYLGGVRVAAEKMKRTSGWNEDGNGTNESGFAGLPGGYRGLSGEFYYIGKYGLWWGTTKLSSLIFRNHGRIYVIGNPILLYNLKRGGFSVRCLRD